MGHCQKLKNNDYKMIIFSLILNSIVLIKGLINIIKKKYFDIYNPDGYYNFFLFFLIAVLFIVIFFKTKERLSKILILFNSFSFFLIMSLKPKIIDFVTLSIAIVFILIYLALQLVRGCAKSSN